MSFWSTRLWSDFTPPALKSISGESPEGETSHLCSQRRNEEVGSVRTDRSLTIIRKWGLDNTKHGFSFLPALVSLLKVVEHKAAKYYDIEPGSINFMVCLMERCQVVLFLCTGSVRWSVKDGDRRVQDCITGAHVLLNPLQERLQIHFKEITKNRQFISRKVNHYTHTCKQFDAR